MERLLRMDDLWKERKSPTPIRVAELALPAADRGDEQLAECGSAWSVDGQTTARPRLGERPVQCGL